MFEFNPDIDWIYMFCRNCWNYQRFLFNKPIPWNTKLRITQGKCDQCDFKQNLNIEQAKKYYYQLNENNF